MIVVKGSKAPQLFKKDLEAEALNWISGESPKFPLKCGAKIRYRQPDQRCILYKKERGLRVLFRQPQRAITPGQSIVFYRRDELLGGGIIK